MSVATVMLVTMKCSLRTVVLLAVWTFLLIWLYQAILKLQKEETAFNHYDEENAFQWPVVNICPMYWLIWMTEENLFNHNYGMNSNKMEKKHTRKKDVNLVIFFVSLYY